MSTESAPQAVTEALEGRVPVLPGLRVYKNFRTLTWSFASIGCASYAYLVGTSLATLGNTLLAVTGYWLGNVIGMALCVLAVGLPSFRHGIDTADAAKSALGVRGALLLMVGIVLSCVGWGNVLIAMTARSAGAIGLLVSSGGQSAGHPHEGVVIFAGCAISLTVWVLSLRGPQVVATLNRWCAPGLVLVAVLLLAMLLHQYSLPGLLHSHVPAAQSITSDPRLQLTLAIEYGLDNGLAMAPFLGGLTRLVAHDRILATPPVLGFATGAGFVSAIAAYAATAAGVADPLSALAIIAGPRIAVAIMLFLILANIGALVTFVYLAGISIQQLKPFSRSPWAVTTAFIVAPSLIVSFRTQWMLDAVMSLLTYNGVFFVGLTGVLIADYYLIRRQVISPAHLFTRSRRGLYWYTGGVNWLAYVVIAATTGLYLTMYNPVSGTVAPSFHFMGAAGPLVLLSATVYFGLARLFDIGTKTTQRPREPVSVEI